MSWRLALLFLALPFQAAAQSAPVVADLTYWGYKDGFHVLTAHSEILLSPSGYRITLTGHTTGLIGLFFRARWHALADGNWTDDGVQPLHFDNQGVFGGHPRRVALQFAGGDPVIRTLSPVDDGEHTPVPPYATRDSIDTLSVTALLVHQVATLGTCQGEVRVFNGRSVEEMSIVRGGADYLAATSRSLYSGPTLRCDLHSHVIAGFFIGDDSPKSRHFDDSVWLATIFHGVPALPVRTTATTHHLGHIVLYLTAAKRRDIDTRTAKTP